MKWNKEIKLSKLAKLLISVGLAALFLIFASLTAKYRWAGIAALIVVLFLLPVFLKLALIGDIKSIKEKGEKGFWFERD